MTTEARPRSPLRSARRERSKCVHIPEILFLRVEVHNETTMEVMNTLSLGTVDPYSRQASQAQKDPVSDRRTTSYGNIVYSIQYMIWFPGSVRWPS